MTTCPSALEQVRIASPCNVSWDQMRGTDRARFCEQCKLHVFNLSDMTREEAVELLQQHTGRTCVRLYRRADGTVLTRDCPVGLRALRYRAARLLVSTAAMLGALFCGSLWAFGGSRANSPAGATSAAQTAGPVGRMAQWIRGPQQLTLPPPSQAMMGDMCIVPPTPANPGAPLTAPSPLSGTPVDDGTQLVEEAP